MAQRQLDSAAEKLGLDDATHELLRCPIGTFGNSPAIYCRVMMTTQLFSPIETSETMVEEETDGCAVPTGLMVFPCTYPGSEMPGYFPTLQNPSNLLMGSTIETIRCHLYS